MQAELVAKYLNELRSKTGLTFETISEKSGKPVSTVKNLCNGKTEDPRLDTVAPVVYALGGSIDEMLNPDIKKGNSKETTASPCQRHIDEIKESNSKLVEQYEKRIAEKNATIKASAVIMFILISIFIVLFIMEIMHPEHGWLRY